MNNKKVLPTTEIVGAILQTRANDEDLDCFKSAPRDFLQEQGVDIKMTEISVVENESAMVHLCLPYYEGLESTASNAITDSDLDSVSGGEIVGLIVAVSVAGAVGLVVTSGAIAGFATAVVKEQEENPK